MFVAVLGILGFWELYFIYNFQQYICKVKIVQLFAINQTKIIKYISVYRMIKILIVLLCVWDAIADCPINLYPRRSVLGNINAQINNNPRLHGTPQQYTYPVRQPFSQAAVNVMIGISAMQLNPANQLNFFVEEVLTTIVTELKFRVIVSGSNNGWRRISFQFFATQSDLFFVFGQKVSSFSRGATDTQLALYRPIPNNQILQRNPVISMAISGLQLTARPLDSSFITLQRQLQSMRKFSSNINVVASFTKNLEQRKAMGFKITSFKILGRALSLNIESNSQVNSLRFSCVIFSKPAVQSIHKYATGDFSLINKNQKKFSQITNTDLIFVGILGLRVPRDSYYIFNLTFNNLFQQSSIEAETNFDYFALDFNFVGFQMQQRFACNDCKDSPNIYDNRFCVSTCPRGFSRTQRLGSFYCQSCDIQKLKVVDMNTGQCVCAKRHYLDNAGNSCKPCRYDCMTCSSPNQCLTCDNNLLQTRRRLGSNGQCVCPTEGFYDDKISQNIVCQKCDPRCLTCNGPFQHDCITCSPARQISRLGFCACRNGFIQDTSGNCTCNPPRVLRNGMCFDTNTNCNENQTEQFVQMTKRCVCKTGFIQIGDRCISCGKNSVFDQSTVSCKCINKTILINGQCTSCPPNQIINQVSNTCVCRPGTFKTQSGSCVTCPPKMVYTSNNKCQCIFNFYQSKSGTCERCLRQTDGPKCRRTSIV